MEPAGLVKFDFLGLKTLTTIRYAVDMVARRGVELDIDAIPIDDAATTVFTPGGTLTASSSSKAPACAGR